VPDRLGLLVGRRQAVLEYLKSFVNKKINIASPLRRMNLARIHHHTRLGQKAAIQKAKLFWSITKITLILLKKRLVNLVFKKNILNTGPEA
jgi:hypothetical protein